MVAELETAFDNNVRLHLYREFVHSGRPPSSARIAEDLRAPLEQVRAALERLASGKAIVLQPESREVLMANPLCAVPTPYMVDAGEQSFFGSCVWDALGIMAMLRRDALLRTSCPCCGEAMAVPVIGSRPSQPQGIIHFALPARRWWENIVFS